MNIEELKKIFSNCEIIGDKIYFNSQIHEAIQNLKDNYSYTLLKSITAIDISGGIELIYDLYSIEHEEDVKIAIKVDAEAESISDIFESAKADENEIYDMFGIKFIGNTDLKRMYMPESWEGYPLRKDYIQDDTRLAWNDNCNNA